MIDDVVDGAGEIPNYTVTFVDVNSVPVEQDIVAASHPLHEIVFISGDLPDLQSLLDGVKAGSEVHILDAHSDELAQMAALLAGRTGFDAIHILSHGSSGHVLLGTTTLTSDNLRTITLQRWPVSALR